MIYHYYYHYFTGRHLLISQWSAWIDNILVASFSFREALALLVFRHWDTGSLCHSWTKYCQAPARPDRNSSFFSLFWAITASKIWPAWLEHLLDFNILIFCSPSHPSGHQLVFIQIPIIVRFWCKKQSCSSYLVNQLLLANLTKLHQTQLMLSFAQLSPRLFCGPISTLHSHLLEHTFRVWSKLG